MRHAEGRIPPIHLHSLVFLADSGELLPVLTQGGPPPLTPAPSIVPDASSAPAVAEAGPIETGTDDPDGASTPRMPTLYPGRLLAQPLELPDTPAPRPAAAVTGQTAALDIVQRKLAEVVERGVRNKLVGLLLNSELDAWLQRRAQEEEARARAEAERRARDEEERRRGVADSREGAKTAEQGSLGKGAVNHSADAVGAEGDVSGGEDDDMEVVVQDSDGEAIEMTEEERAAARRADRDARPGTVDALFAHGPTTGEELGLAGEERLAGAAGAGTGDAWPASETERLTDGRELGEGEGEGEEDNRVTASEEERGRQALEKHRALKRRKEEGEGGEAMEGGECAAKRGRG